MTIPRKSFKNARVLNKAPMRSKVLQSYRSRDRLMLGESNTQYSYCTLHPWQLKC